MLIKNNGKNNFILKKIPDIFNDFQRNLNTQAVENLLSRYDGMVEFIRSPEILTTILFYQESVMSSKIEGTIATISDILNYKVSNELSSEKTKIDVVEIENYQKALGYCIEVITQNNFIITSSLLKEIQSILLSGTRGQNKLKGKFKERQNFIGNNFDRTITYTPPSPLHTEDYVNDLVEFINSDTSDFNPLVKIAFIHAYFELIHPFEDGNGRVGRILIPILLKKYGALTTPYFYISYFLSKNREKYINCLESISRDNNWGQWISFFIEILTMQTEMLIKMLRKLKEIRENTEKKLLILKTQFSITILNFLFKRIKFTTTTFIKETKINSNTSQVLLRSMEKKGILFLERKSKGQLPSIYRFIDLYEIVEELSE